ncbi:hypothetical protein llg_34830 [Luteolibacter sp. LG18]|nr:hypothetical protein llg_34830 [Luteolibacter sp. LG18]
MWRKLGGGSLSISILVHALLLAIGVVWIFQIIPAQKKEDVSFLPSSGGGGSGAKSEAAQKKRASMTTANAPRLSAKGATSSFSLPEIDPSSSMSSVGALSSGGLSGGLGGSGSGGGRGDGRGTGIGSGMGPGLGGQGPGVMFFNQKMDAQRVAYVIDYSQSMAGKREKLMRKELAASVAGLSPLSKFQLIFFSGPAWVAGDTIEGDNQSGKVEVKSAGGEGYKWETVKPKGWGGDWKTVGKRQKPEWMNANSELKGIAARRIQETPLSIGTCWTPSLEMALAMDPAPNVIFFMTDGVAETTEMRAIIAKAKVKGTVINTIAMMEPKAGEDMKKLAHGTGGKFTIVEESGQVREEP